MSTRPPSRPLHSTSSISRTLFHSRLSRRPTSSSTSTTATTLVESPPESNSSEILVRNQNGDYTVTVPTLPAPDEESAEAEAEPQLDTKEVENRLTEMLSNRTRQSSDLELLEAVQASLRRKVEALDEDKWIFESEDGRS